MICHDFKCIFIHIPKAAGQSVEHFFLDKLNLDWGSRSPLLLRFNDEPKVGPCRLAHMKCVDYVKYHYLSQELYDRYFKFSFVRNPWSRAVSFYNFLGYNSVMTFESFAGYQLPILIKKRYWFMMPQYEFLYYKGNLMVDFVGKFENIQNDFKQVCDQLGFPNSDLPHINQSVKKKQLNVLRILIKEPKIITKLSFSRRYKTDFRSYYTKKSKEDVYAIYKQDIDTFGYQY